jgi:uncharacterized protein (UPF0332 family)
MSFNWTTYLALAKKLNESDGSHPPAEENRRSAVSRAYYFVYHTARSHVESEGLQIPRRDPHASLVALLRGHFDQKGMKLASQLERMRDYRNQADYDSIFPYDREWVDAMISRSEQFVGELDKLKLS